MKSKTGPVSSVAAPGTPQLQDWMNNAAKEIVKFVRGYQEECEKGGKSKIGVPAENGRSVFAEIIKRHCPATTLGTREETPAVNDVFPSETDAKLAREIHKRFCGGIDEACTDETEWIAQRLAETYRALPLSDSQVEAERFRLVTDCARSSTGSGPGDLQTYIENLWAGVEKLKRELAETKLLFYNAMNIDAMKAFPTVAQCQDWLDAVCGLASRSAHAEASERAMREALDTMLVEMAQVRKVFIDHYGTPPEFVVKFVNDRFEAARAALASAQADKEK